MENLAPPASRTRILLAWLMLAVGLGVGVFGGQLVVEGVTRWRSPAMVDPGPLAAGEGFLPLRVPVAQAGAGGENPASSSTGSPEASAPNASSSTGVSGNRPPLGASQVYEPDRISIPAIRLDAPVVPAIYSVVEVEGALYEQWEAPNLFAAGWQSGSAALGEAGNTVLIGHHNMAKEVFRYLEDLKLGDRIQLRSGAKSFSYEITDRILLPETFKSLEVRIKNAEWISPTLDERLTLVTCWPYESNTYRLVIVAKPYDAEDEAPLGGIH